VKLRPIIFSAESMRAMLETPPRKTQTRRVVKEPRVARLHGRKSHPADRHHADRGFPYDDGQHRNGYLKWGYAFGAEEGGDGGDEAMERVYCPYEPGARLWCRETVWLLPDHTACAYGEQPDARWEKRSAIYMPKWACRLALEIKSVRAERLHDITEEDARAEGVLPVVITLDCGQSDAHSAACGGGGFGARDMFGVGWDALNGKRDGGAFAWAKNPFVWVVAFSVLAGDELEAALCELRGQDGRTEAAPCER
jgi:hypothetical protein